MLSKYNSPLIQFQIKLKITEKIFTLIKKSYTLHLCCALPDSIKSLKVLILKILSVSQARSLLGRSFHSFAVAYSNVDWPIAVLYLGRRSSLLSLMALRRSSDLYANYP